MKEQGGLTRVNVRGAKGTNCMDTKLNLFESHMHLNNHGIRCMIDTGGIFILCKPLCVYVYVCVRVFVWFKIPFSFIHNPVTVAKPHIPI